MMLNLREINCKMPQAYFFIPEMFQIQANDGILTLIQEKSNDLKGNL